MQYGRTSKRNIHRDAEWEARASERASGLQRYLENMSGQTVRVNITFHQADNQPPDMN